MDNMPTLHPSTHPLTDRLVYPLPMAQPLPKTIYMDWAPFGGALGMHLFGFNGDQLCIGLPWTPTLIGNPAQGSVHGGVITAMIDQAFGASVFKKIRRREAIATVELRIDYMRPAQPHKDIFCRAECYRVTRQIAFTRGDIFQDDPDRPLAHSVGTFMRNSSDMPDMPTDPDGMSDLWNTLDD